MENNSAKKHWPTESSLSQTEPASPRGSVRLVVNDADLSVVRHTLSLNEYIRGLVQRRDFILGDARAKAFRTTKNYNWWRFWLVASPILEALMYGAVFTLLLKTNRGIDNFVGFVIIGITIFGVTSRMLMGGVGLLEANRSMIRTFAFPRAAVVLSNALRYTYDTLPSIVVAIVAALAFQLPEPPPWTVILVVPLYLLAIGFGTGLMFIGSRMTALIPDTRAILELFVRGWMFASGIFYSMERYASDPTVYAIFTANPAYQFIHAFRQVVMWGEVPSWSEWGTLLAWSVGTLVFGFLYFWKAENRYAKF